MVEVYQRALMGDASADQITGLLQAWRSGDEAALAELTPVVYGQLHRLATANMNRERPGHMLQPSALVNEAFVRLLAEAGIDWKNRAHFFAFAARLMRQILVDAARAQASVKRGNRMPHVDLAVANEVGVASEHADLIDIDRALDDLAQLEPRQARVVELRYFAGLENPEIAEVLGVSECTVQRDWRVARAWLYYRLRLPAGKTEKPGP